MRPVATTSTVGPVHDCPLHTRLYVLGPALQGWHSGCLGGGWELLHVCRFDLQYLVWCLTLRYYSGLSQMFQWFHLLSLIMHISTRWYKV